MIKHKRITTATAVPYRTHADVLNNCFDLGRRYIAYQRATRKITDGYVVWFPDVTMHPTTDWRNVLSPGHTEIHQYWPNATAGNIESKLTDRRIVFAKIRPQEYLFVGVFEKTRTFNDHNVYTRIATEWPLP